VLVGRALATELLALNTDENVRGYLVDADGKKRKRRGEVHRKIQDTIENYPENFCVLNGGIVIVARDYSSDDKAKLLTLTRPSIINGAQTQGVLRDCARAYGNDFPNLYVTFEVIVSSDEDLIAEVSIARNFQNDVKNISIAGSLGTLDELETALRSQLGTEVKIKKSETDRSEDFIDTEKLLQVIMALTPIELFQGSAVSVRESKAYTYSQKATCLKDFSAVHKAVHEADKGKSSQSSSADRRLYDYFLNIAGEAHQLYEKWKTHQGFRGTGLRCIERENGAILDVPDGIVFPIISSLSVFAKKVGSYWTIEQPSQLTDSELIQTAKTAYIQIAASNPQTMGKKSACYSQILGITSVYKKLAAT